MNLYFNRPGRGTRLEPSQSLINWVPSFLLGSDSSTSLSCEIGSDSGEFVELPLEKQEEDEVQHDFVASLSREYRGLAGPWDSHRFENKAWIPPTQKDSTTEIQPAKAKVESELSKKTLPQDPVKLTTSMIVEGLSYLERSPETSQYAYTKLVLSRKGIYLLDLLKTYKFIQYLDISSNKLKSLAPLENMIYLKHLDASYNHLDVVLDFKAPFFLTTVNLSHNRIRYLRDISDFWSLVDLNLSHNYIKEIYGFDSLRYLNTLNLSHNEIEEIEHLQGLRLQYLYLQNNSIKYDLTGGTKDPQFDSLPHLRFVNLSNNEIKSLKMFETVVNLEILEASHNGISELLEICYLRNLNYLTRLNLESNPVVNLKRYVEVCVSNVKNLVILDHQQLNFEFWQEKMSQKISENDVVQQAHKQRLKLLIMEQVNKPVMWNWVQPYDIPPLGVIMLVGPKGSRRARLMQKFCKCYEGIILGVLHTTRPRHKDEIEGEDFYFISHETFMTMLKNGEFLTFYETLGNYFAIAHTEFEKSLNGVVIFRGDLISALALKSKFFNAKLVLSVSSTESDHVNTLQSFYSLPVDADTVRIVRSQDTATKQQEERDKIVHTLVENDVGIMLSNIIDNICLANSEEFLSKIKKLYVQSSQDFFQMWARGDPAMVEIPELLEPLKDIFFTKEAWRELSGILELPDEFRSKTIDTVTSEDNKNGKKNVSFVLTSKSSSKEDKLSENKQYILKCLKVLRNSSNLDQPPEEGDEVTNMMRRIIDYFLKTRTQLLELHFSMPGLFRELIFPDKEEESIEKLIKLAKDTFFQGNVPEVKIVKF